MTRTRDQILALPAGRALDALVAERIFSRHRADFPGVNGESHFWTAVERYSTEIAAVWDVVECLQDRMFTLHLRTFKRNRWELATASFRREGENGDEAVLCSTPHAICIAALLTTLENL